MSSYFFVFVLQLRPIGSPFFHYEEKVETKIPCSNNFHSVMIWHDHPLYYTRQFFVVYLTQFRPFMLVITENCTCCWIENTYFILVCHFYENPPSIYKNLFLHNLYRKKNWNMKATLCFNDIEITLDFVHFLNQISPHVWEYFCWFS